MGRVTQEQKESGRPQLRPDKFGNASLLIATIAGVVFKPSQFRSGMQPVLTFKEPAYNTYQFRVGKRGTANLCEKFGDETDRWVNQAIPLLQGTEVVDDATHVVYQVPPVTEWAELFKTAKQAGKAGK